MKKNPPPRQGGIPFPRGRNENSTRISPKRFDEWAKSCGLDTRDYDKKELYLSVWDFLKSLKDLEQVDLKGISLAPAFYPPTRKNNG